MVSSLEDLATRLSASLQGSRIMNPACRCAHSAPRRSRRLKILPHAYLHHYRELESLILSLPYSCLPHSFSFVTYQQQHGWVLCVRSATAPPFWAMRIANLCSTQGLTATRAIGLQPAACRMPLSSATQRAGMRKGAACRRA